MVYLVLAENGFLLVSGILVGILSALIATSPQIVKNLGRVPMLPMTTVILTIVVSALLFLISAYGIIRHITPTALRRE